MSISITRVLDSATELPILTFEQPFNNHNGGEMAFGADGYLYIGFGDGGGSGDPYNIGSMLRIDVNRTTGAVPYAIPADNPFSGNPLCSQGSGSAPCPEIYAWGPGNGRYVVSRCGSGRLGGDRHHQAGAKLWLEPM